MIIEAENVYEVAGVLAHEMGHIEKRHTVSKLVKEFGKHMIIYHVIVLTL